MVPVCNNIVLTKVILYTGVRQSLRSHSIDHWRLSVIPVLFLLWHVKMSAAKTSVNVSYRMNSSVLVVSPLEDFNLPCVTASNPKPWGRILPSNNYISLHLIMLWQDGSSKLEWALLNCWNMNRFMTFYTLLWHREDDRKWDWTLLSSRCEEVK